MLLLVCLPPNTAVALGPDGAPIDTSDYTIDFYEGPVLHSSRVIGLGGSIAALAEGVIGYADNPATAAMRVPWSRSWFDWELDASITSPSSLVATDFDNNGSLDSANRNALFFTLGGGLQFGRLGIGVHADVNEYRVESRASGAEQDAELKVNQARINLVLAYLFLDGQLAVGAGLGTYDIEMSFANQSDASAPAVAAVSGGSVQFGAVVAPSTLPLRAGASVRFGLPPEEGEAAQGVAADANGNYFAEGYYFPARISPPTVVQFAVATQFFRKFNGPWIVPQKWGAGKRELEPQYKAPRFEGRRGHLLLSAGLEVTLGLHNGVGIESFLTQQVQRSGRSATFSPRVGVEVEPWTNFLILRAGNYLEPTRFAAGSPRIHFTAGTDLHIPLAWSVFGLLDADTTFRIGGAVDRAHRYFGWSASLGVWH